MNPVESLFHNLNGSSSLNFDEAEQQMLKRLQPLLTHSPEDLLAILLGQAETNGASWEWATPLPFIQAEDGG